MATVHDLVRTRDGVVHTADCAQALAGDVTAWTWAQGREMDEVIWALAMIGSRPCPTCRPLG